MILRSSTLIIACAAMISACVINGAMAQTTSKKRVNSTKHANYGGADIVQGKSLIAKSDCLSCHRLDIKLIGPAYKEVALKYPANEKNYSLLTQKVINGGSGTWGPVAMSPHPNLSVTDVRKMVKYILTIK